MQTEHGATYCVKCHVSSPPRLELIAKHESNLAPQWLIFPKDIFNAQRITHLSIADGKLVVYTSDHHYTIITVSDLETTWKALQMAFADGVAKKP